MEEIPEARHEKDLNFYTSVDIPLSHGIFQQDEQSQRV